MSMTEAARQIRKLIELTASNLTDEQAASLPYCFPAWKEGMEVKEGDTVTEDKLLKGATAHGKDGEVVTGVCTFDVDSNDATAAVAEILKGKTAYARGKKLVGTMPNNGAVKGVISNKDDSYVIAQGYHDGSGTVGISETEKEKLIPSNIREGINILGVDGQMSGSEGMKPQSKTITPSSAQQTILPDEGYNCLSQVIVEKIPYVESENSAGGLTVTIG